jgi:hypothetical protein
LLRDPVDARDPCEQDPLASCGHKHHAMAWGYRWAG